MRNACIQAARPHDVISPCSDSRLGRIGDQVCHGPQAGFAQRFDHAISVFRRLVLAEFHLPCSRVPPISMPTIWVIKRSVKSADAFATDQGSGKPASNVCVIASNWQTSTKGPAPISSCAATRSNSRAKALGTCSQRPCQPALTGMPAMIASFQSALISSVSLHQLAVGFCQPPALKIAANRIPDCLRLPPISGFGNTASAISVA